MPNPLNPSLYARLVRSMGRVRISAEGEAMIARGVRDEAGEPRMSVEHAGEYYRVNCPYCTDTRYRLYVNHMFGQQDDFGRRMLFLAVCYNENCLANGDNASDLIDRIDDMGFRAAVVKQGIIVREEARQVQPPGPTTLLSDLPAAHPARVYMTSRGFDVGYLSRRWEVSYCESSRFSLASNRIIFPIYDRGKLKGWQARHIGELDWKGPRRKELPPKYFSCPDSDFRSKCIYGFDVMKGWETGVIVEGPTDKLRFGPMSGCIFGNSMTEVQRRRFVAVFRKRTAVLLLDPEEFDSASTRRTVEFFTQQMPGRFCAVKLPDKTDPGSLGREFGRAYVKERAAELGVKVSYRLAV